jgi:hypothetical protein
MGGCVRLPLIRLLACTQQEMVWRHLGLSGINWRNARLDSKLIGRDTLLHMDQFTLPPGSADPTKGQRDPTKDHRDPSKDHTDPTKDQRDSTKDQ